MNAEYIGIHDEHAGPNIESVEYDVHSACQSTIYVWFEDTPDLNVLTVWFYKDGEEVEVGKQEIGELDMDNRENFEFQYCTIDKYDSFRVGVTRE